MDQKRQGKRERQSGGLHTRERKVSENRARVEKRRPRGARISYEHKFPTLAGEQKLCERGLRTSDTVVAHRREKRKTREQRQNSYRRFEMAKGRRPTQWPTWIITPTTEWNYALCTDEPIRLVKKSTVKEDENPYTSTEVPLVFKAKGRKVPVWKVDKYGLCAPLPDECAAQSNEKYDIELIPMGAARLRISSFPQGK